MGQLNNNQVCAPLVSNVKIKNPHVNPVRVTSCRLWYCYLLGA